MDELISLTILKSSVFAAENILIKSGDKELRQFQEKIVMSKPYESKYQVLNYNLKFILNCIYFP